MRVIRRLVVGWMLVAPVSAMAAEDGVASAMDRFWQDLSRDRGDGGPAAQAGLETVRQALALVVRDYVRPVPADALLTAAVEALRRRSGGGGRVAGDWVDAALTGMMSGLDSYSTYLTERQYATLRDRFQGRFGGVGVELTLERDSGFARVVSPLDGGPAAGGGLVAGDLIAGIGGAGVAGLSLQEMSDRIRGEPGTTVQLTVVRPAAAPRVVTLVRSVIKVEPVSARIDGAVAYLRLSTFNFQAASAFDRAVAEIGRSAGGRVTGVVLDLRNNPGGVVDQAVAIAGRFLAEGTIVSVRGRRPAETVNHVANRGDAFPGLPLVVLINGGTASSSEIVGAALQDHRRAVLIGSRSFGKGTVQTTTALDPGGAITLTTAQYYRPSGHAVECFGVEPNVVIPSETAVPRGETARCPADPPPPPAAVSWRMEDVCPEVLTQAPVTDRSYACARAALQNGVMAGQ